MRNFNMQLKFLDNVGLGNEFAEKRNGISGESVVRGRVKSDDCSEPALNEMWKCQNMLRHHVRDLLDLHKQQKVSMMFFCLSACNE
eukprot:g39908.t1